MMMDYGMGWNWGWGFGWIAMLLFWLVPILLVLAAIKYLFFGRSGSQAGARSDEDRALAVLEERYARGDINRDEFLQKRNDLRGK